MTDLIGYLPDVLREVLEFKAITDAENSEINDIKADLIDILNQCFIDTATWGLSYWEKEQELPISLSLSDEERRSIIKARLRGLGAVTEELIKEIADAWTNGEVKVIYENSAITVQFTSFIGTPPNVDNVRSAIEEIKPAHLRLILSNRYFTIAELEKLTLEELEQQPLNKFSPFV